MTDIQLMEIRANLTYRNKAVQYEIQRLKNSPYYNEKTQEKINELKAKEVVCLLNQDPNGEYWCLSGLHPKLKKYTEDLVVNYKLPEADSIPWAKVPDKTPFPYQTAAKEALLKANHARVEMGTGLGKSFIILNLVKELGLKTVVMAPSQNIAEQLYNDFLLHFGKKYVGKFFDGKKEPKKLFVIGTGASLTRVEPGSPVAEELAKTQVFISDESHQCPAATFEKVCIEVLRDAPYRFFFSATQLRNDGQDLLLDAITGPTVYEMTVQEGVDQNYLAKPVFKIIETSSDSSFYSKDANEMTRKHLYYNPRVLQQAAAIANNSVEHLGHQVLILIDEVEQFTRLAPHLKFPAKFAHGPLGENKEKVPKEYQEVDNGKLVDSFNKCEYPILVGTSAISTGTDIRSVKTMIYLKGGKSEIEVRQGVGRCTRLEKSISKTACTVVDFDVSNIDLLHKHAKTRIKIYEDIYPEVELVEW